MTRSRGSSAHRARLDVLPASFSLADWVFTHAQRTPDAPAVASPSACVTYGQLGDRVRHLAARLADTGVSSGTRVMVVLPSTPATVVVGLALNALGAVSLECSRDWGIDLLGEVVRTTGTRHLFVAARDVPKWIGSSALDPIEYAWVLEGSAVGGRRVDGVVEDTSVDGLLEDGSLAAPPAQPLDDDIGADVEPDQPALVLYTSGSLGRPLGVIQTFANIDSNSRAIVEYLELTANDRAMLTLPLHYCYGRSVLQTHLLVGGSVYLDHRMSFPRRVLETTATEGCTGFAGVPLTFEMIRRQVDVTSIPLTRLRYLTQAGGAMAAETIAWVRRAFSPARLFVMYGQTEATARLSYLPPERADDKRGSIGIPIPGVELRVVDPAGDEVPPGTEGEIVARGPNVTPGYLDDPVDTARILRDGWLWTGDLAIRDEDGYLYHRGRAREIIKVGGHRVSPAEVEQVVAQHADVAEAVVIGQPDDLQGEVPVAVIVPRGDGHPDEEALRRFLRDNLAPWQVPARLVVVSSLPRNAAGKPLRAEIARRYREPTTA